MSEKLPDRVLITPPLPEELWYRVRELQTQRIKATLEIDWENGAVTEWRIIIKESSITGRTGLRMQTRHDK